MDEILTLENELRKQLDSWKCGDETSQKRYINNGFDVPRDKPTPPTRLVTSCSSSVQSNWSRAEGLVFACGLFAFAVAAGAPGSWPLANVWYTFTPHFLVIVFFSRC